MKEYTFKIDSTDYKVSVEETETNQANVVVNGIAHTVEIENMQTASSVQSIKKSIATPPKTQAASTNQPKEKNGQEHAIKSPLPGIILDVFVKEGDHVTAGQKIILLEAMKMENNIESDKEGTVTQIKIHKGDSVCEDDVLILIS